MNYRPIFYIGTSEIGRNSQVFATHDEAFASARDLFKVWTLTFSSAIVLGVEQTDDPVTYTRKNNTDYNLQTGMLKGETT